MPKPKLIRGLTLLFFLSFMTAFVLYRSGKFDSSLWGGESEIQTSPNGGNLTSVPTDTLPRLRRDSTRVMLPTSKSLGGTTIRWPWDPPKLRYRDSILAKKIIDSLRPIKYRQILMFSGSKSGPVFRASLDQLESGFYRIDPDSTRRLLKKEIL